VVASIELLPQAALRTTVLVCVELVAEVPSGCRCHMTEVAGRTDLAAQSAKADFV
jgi:hypothetical protein